MSERPTDMIERLRDYYDRRVEGWLATLPETVRGFVRDSMKRQEEAFINRCLYGTDERPWANE